MVVAALHDSVKQEVVARRLAGSTVGLVFRILTLYQPGGEGEKIKILQNLQSPSPESEAGQAVTALRTWSRWLRRCTDLGVQAPDPSLLARGLTRMVQAVMEKNQDASFRTWLVKSTLQIDTNPSYDKVDSYYKHLMAECEALAVAATGSPMTVVNTGGKAEPRLRPMKPEPKAPSPTPPKTSTPTPTTTDEGTKFNKPKAEVPCRFFGKSAKGCTRAGKCPFLHSWEGLEKKDRCLTCGGKGHVAKDCPTKKSPSTSNNGTPKNANERTTTPASTSSTTNARTVRVDDRPDVVPVPSRGSEEGASSAAEIKEVLADVGKVLKAMTATTLKKFEVRKTEASNEVPVQRIESEELEEMDGLLDSGASHAMRPASSAEYSTGSPVKVALAGEDVRILKQNDQGTILVKEQGEPVQPIVPLGALIQKLGYTLSWGPKHLKLTHPAKGPIQVKIKNHCPEVAACDALNMIRELEMNQVQELNSQVETLKARLEVLRKEEERSWTELLKDYSKTGKRGLLLKAILKCPFTKCLPGEVQSLLLEDFNPDAGEVYLKDLPITRRKRKALMNSPN